MEKTEKLIPCPKCKKRAIQFEMEIKDDGVLLDWKKCSECGYVMNQNDINNFIKWSNYKP